MLRHMLRYSFGRRVSLLGAAVLALACPNTSRAAGCSADLPCLPGYAEISEPNGPKFRDLYDGISVYLNYCATTQVHPYADLIWNSPVVGFSKDCHRLLSGQYGANGKTGDWAYYRANGTPMATAHFTNGAQIWRQWISPMGQNIRFDKDIESPSLFKGEPTLVSIMAETWKGSLPYMRKGVKARFDWLCPGPADIIWNFSPLVRAFEQSSISVQFSRSDSTSALYISAR